jgi:hypothetical protein
VISRGAALSRAPRNSTSAAVFNGTKDRRSFRLFGRELSRRRDVPTGRESVWCHPEG